MGISLRAAAMLCVLACCAPALGAETSKGEILLQRNCSRCHAVTPGAASPLAQAPNLYIVLGSYPGERLEVELGEGIGSLHENMPQVQFSEDDISDIYYYLHGTEPDLPPQH